MTTVQAALSRVIEELPAIGKGDKSPQGYSFRGIEAITKHLQPLLAKHGVVIVPSATITNVVPSPGMKDSWQDIYTSRASRDLYDRVAATKGTPLADELKAFAAENRRALKASEFDADPKFAEQIATLLDAA